MNQAATAKITVTALSSQKRSSGQEPVDMAKPPLGAWKLPEQSCADGATAQVTRTAS